MTNDTLTFFVVSFFLVISPGPNMALIIDNASRLGKSNSMANVLGLCTATYLHGALSILGVSAILLKNKYLFMTIKILGAIYLLYMGLKSIVSGLNELKNKSYSFIEKEREVKKVKFIYSYRDGLMTQILNPKVSIFYMAAFPNFISGKNNISRGFELVAIHSINIFTWFTILTIFISFTSSVLKNKTVRGWINISTGVVLAVFSLLIFIE